MNRKSSRPRGWLGVTEVAKRLKIPKPTLYGVLMVKPKIVPTREHLGPDCGRRRPASLLSLGQQKEILKRIGR